MQDLERELERAVFHHPQIKRLFSERYRRALLLERRRKRTALDWLYLKGLISENEHRAGKALAMLIEWRAAALTSASTSIPFQQKAIQAPPHKVPVELPLLIRQSDNDGMGEGGTVIDVDEIRIKPGNAVDLFNQTIQDRLTRTACAMQEVRRLTSVLKRALPERPDLMILLGHCVTERITRHEIPSHDVEVLCKALYVVKELWRYELLEDLIDEATGICIRNTRRGRAAPRHPESGSIPARTGREASEARDGDRAPRAAQGYPLQAVGLIRLTIRIFAQGRFGGPFC